jgi:hypothetical protein
VEIQEIDFEQTNFSLVDLDALKIEDTAIVLQLIPYWTTDRNLIQIVSHLLPRFSGLLVKTDENKKLFKECSVIFKCLTRFILCRDVKDISAFVEPLSRQLSDNDRSCSLIEKFIVAEDNLNKPEQFWKIWNCIYPHVKKFDFRGLHAQSSLIVVYLLATDIWNRGIKEWHSLDEKNLTFYSRIANDLSCVPAVLYSIVKVLNSIGSRFVDSGLNWIDGIVTRNNDLSLGEIESSTLFYLETLLRTYIFMNLGIIKKEKNLRDRIIRILDFMIVRGSAHGYWLRESIL